MQNLSISEGWQNSGRFLATGTDLLSTRRGPAGCLWVAGAGVQHRTNHYHLWNDVTGKRLDRSSDRGRKRRIYREAGWGPESGRDAVRPHPSLFRGVGDRAVE